MLERTGPALGLYAGAEYEEHKVLFDMDDRLLLYTDGVLAEGVDASTSQDLAEVLCSGVDRCALPSTLYREATQDAAGERDDITIILLERGEGESHFDDTPTAEERTAPQPAVPEHTALMKGNIGECAYIIVSGTLVWTSSQTFLDGTKNLFQDYSQLIIDLGACEYLDSTCLGTLYEVVVSRPESVSIQHMPESIRALFDELSMSAVLDRASSGGGPLPDELEPLLEREIDSVLQGERMLTAHETLASLSPENRDKFQGVVDSLRTDLERQP